MKAFRLFLCLLKPPMRLPRVGSHTKSRDAEKRVPAFLFFCFFSVEKKTPAPENRRSMIQFGRAETPRNGAKLFHQGMPENRRPINPLQLGAWFDRESTKNQFLAYSVLHTYYIHDMDNNSGCWLCPNCGPVEPNLDRPQNCCGKCGQVDLKWQSAPPARIPQERAHSLFSEILNSIANL